MKKDLKEKILKLRSENYTFNQIKDILKCSKSTVSYYCSPKSEIEKICAECGEKFTTKRNSNLCCSDECRIKYRKNYAKANKYQYDKLILWRKNKKIKAIEYKGGCCVLCGYNKCSNSLVFHHINPEEKDFTISAKPNISFGKIKNELDKCILVCSNCHGEIHDGLHNEILKEINN